MRHGEIVCDRSTPGPSTVFTRPHNRQRTMLWTQEHKRDDNTGRAPLFSAAAPGLERVSHLIVYPPSLSPSSCAWTAPQKQGDDECSSLSVAEHNFHKMPTIFTKCPQSNVFCFHKILLLTPVSLQIWFLFISDFRLNPLSVRTHFVKFQQYQLSGLCIIVFFQTNYSNSGDSPCRQSCFQRFR